MSSRCVCLQGGAAAAAKWPGRISVMSQLTGGTLVWTREASRGLTRESHFRGIFLTAGEVTKGVQAFHDNVLCDWWPETESFAVIIISMYCLTSFLFGGGYCLGFCRGEAGFGKRSYSSQIPSLAHAVRKIPEHLTNPGAWAWSWAQGTEVQHLVLTFCLLLANPAPDSVSPFVKQC